MSSCTIPSAVQNIHDDLRHFKHDKWGWIIYRSTYGDDEAWTRFQQTINERSRERMAKPGVPPEVANSLEWTFVSDPITLDGASRDQLRRRFRAWAAEAGRTEQPRAADHEKNWNGLRSQRYTYFVQVDEEALRSVVDADPSDRWDVGWVNLVRADEEQDFGRDAKKEDAEEADDEEGWMMISAHMLGPDFYDAIGQMPENCTNYSYFHSANVTVRTFG
ncbi:MAG: hypothetical protein Q9207_000177 [Kuettlingeria erythrocarpa]